MSYNYMISKCFSKGMLFAKGGECGIYIPLRLVLQMNREVVIFCDVFPKEKVLGLTPFSRTILGFKKAGVNSIYCVTRDVKGLESAVPQSAINIVKLVQRKDGENEVNVLRDILSNNSNVELIVLSSDVVVGQKDAIAIVNTPLKPNGGVIIGDGSVYIFSPEVIIKTLDAKSVLDIAQMLDMKGLLVRFSPISLVQRYNGHEKEVEENLLYSLRKPIDVDGVVCYYFQRPITRQISKILSRFPIKPDHITIMAIILGIASGFFVATGTRENIIIGAFMFYAGAFLDCIDGEIARLKFEFSKFGEWLDTIADDSSTFSFIAGMTYALSHKYDSVAIMYLGFAVLLAFMFSSLYIYRSLVQEYHSGDVTVFRWSCLKQDTEGQRGIWDLLKFLIKRDFFTTLFFILALLDIIEVAFGLACISVAIYFSVFLVEITHRGKPTLNH